MKKEPKERAIPQVTDILMRS